MRSLAPVPLLALVAAACGDVAATDPCSAHGFRFEAKIDPDPPCVCQNTLRIRLTDAFGAPVEGAAVTVDPQMPIHGHGSTQVPVVTDLGGGHYEAFPVTLVMSGPWELYLYADGLGCHRHHVDVP